MSGPAVTAAVATADRFHKLFFAALLSPILDGFDQLLSYLHFPLSKQCALSINLYDIKI